MIVNEYGSKKRQETWTSPSSSIDSSRQIDMFAYHVELCSPVEPFYRALYLKSAGIMLKAFIIGNERT
jgi:hypothetical protein